MIGEELFDQLEHCPESEQRKKIEEMNEIIDGMNKKEFESVFTTRMFDKIYKMIDEKKMTMENALLPLKHAGYCDALKRNFDIKIFISSLNKRFEKMIFNENKKKEGKNEKLLADLCECYLLLSPEVSSELLLICVPCFLKVASVKEETEEVQKEVEMVLLALSNIVLSEVPKELYLNEIKEIIQYHQEHHNLTRLAYQSAWGFLIYRLDKDKSLNEVIVNELHFAREAARELEELTKRLNWKNKFEETSKEEANELLVIRGWIQTLEIFVSSCQLWNEEFVGLISSVVQVFREAKDNYRDICERCIYILQIDAKIRAVKIDVLLESEAVDAVLEEIWQSTLNEGVAHESFNFFLNVSERLKEKTDNEMEEVNRKATKMEIFEKMEEEGYEDTIASLYETFDFLNEKYHDYLSLHISDYFINV
ncbi:uncharacterized protein MONOS_3951 [Monocercomonoides exilis]|uniref:uncharacterized protein n=1 Tax=Monocercomonoides exilis TaxID=2049356 RepID=UPI00355A4405|nr:hypothetical protein MONOS_3951 [Monocercomonoides exilis]|eukprot:MONOS_3951.1-p1 / transcript=MONOS_3951.1 / gene=MONOS_3951 / organism=Monocercomonoides_exilis_PA203 / gene_product=unspecified product / transcript_product=unspecified product / location=Mono_scaffold00098:120533-121857(+) / protein_length=423 / sequence_SO=supercontig / SO=protein_coding / is_pseudo=false